MAGTEILETRDFMFMGFGCFASGFFCGLRVYCGDRDAGAAWKKCADVRGAWLPDGSKGNASGKKASPIPRQTQAGTREKRSASMVRGIPMPARQPLLSYNIHVNYFFPSCGIPVGGFFAKRPGSRLRHLATWSGGRRDFSRCDAVARRKNDAQESVPTAMCSPVADF